LVCLCLSVAVFTKHISSPNVYVEESQVSEEDLFGVFYKVIGNGNFYAQLVRVSTSNGDVEVLGNVANVYASYPTPGALNPLSETLFWPYPSQNGGTAFYVVGLPNGFNDVFYYDSATVNMQFSSKDNRLYAVTTNSINRQEYNFSYIDVEQKQEKIIFPLKNFLSNIQAIASSLDEQSGKYFVVNSTVLATIDITQKTVSYLQLTGDCIGTLSIFFDSKFELLYGLRLFNNSIYIVKLKPNGDCTLLSKSIVSFNPPVFIYDATYNQQTSNIAFLPFSYSPDANGLLTVFNVNSGTVTHQFKLSSASYYTSLLYLNN
jgi:hypothetical protein